MQRTTTTVFASPQSAGATPNPNLAGTPVEGGSGSTPSAFSESTLDALGAPLIPITSRTATEEPAIDLAKLNAIVLHLQNEFSKLQTAMAEKSAQEASITKRESEVTQRETEIEKQATRMTEGMSGVVDGFIKNSKIDLTNPSVITLSVLKLQLPALEEMRKNANTLESKNEFAQITSIIVGNVVKNALLIANSNRDTNQAASLDSVKNDLLSNQGLTVILGQHRDLNTPLILAIAALKEETLPVLPTTTKEILMAKLLGVGDTLSSAMFSAKYPLIALLGYAVAQAEAVLLSPVAECITEACIAEATVLGSILECIKNYVLAMQTYTGALTIPLLLSMGYVAYYVSYMLKERFRPTDENVKQERLFAQHAVKIAA